MLLALFAIGHWGRLRLRERAADRLSRQLTETISAQLAHRRRALIRTRPLSAWQDFHSRHLPVLERYLLDYQLQRRLVATLPLLALLLVLPLSWLAAAVLLLTMPLIPLFMWLVGRGASALQRRHIVALDRLGGMFGDRIEGRTTIRLHNAAAREVKRFQRASRELNRRLAKVLRVAFLSSSVLDFFSTLSIALVAVFTGFALLGELPLGFWGGPPSFTHALFILLLTPAFFAELQALGRLYHARSDALGAAAAWAGVIDAPAPTPPRPIDRFERLTIAGGTVGRLEGGELLTVPRLTLARGDRVLLRGPSGAGKSALLEALAGLRPLTGTLSLNGTAVDNFGALRDRALLLDQSPAFFPGTVGENLALGSEAHPGAAAALTAVGLDDWLRQLPLGLETPMGDTPMLSGGQRQRFSLARLRLFEPDLVLLDEPTAHLGDEDRAVLEAQLLESLAGRTLIWASHEPLPAEHFNGHWQLTSGTAERRPEVRCDSA